MKFNDKKNRCVVCNNANCIDKSLNRCLICGWYDDKTQFENPYLANKRNILSLKCYSIWYSNIKALKRDVKINDNFVEPNINDLFKILIENDDDFVICQICQSHINKRLIDICPVCAWTTLFDEEEDYDEGLVEDGPNYLSFTQYKNWYKYKKLLIPNYTFDKYGINTKMIDEYNNVIDLAKSKNIIKD